jgi:hypothetical protein
MIVVLLPPLQNKILPSSCPSIEQYSEGVRLLTVLTGYVNKKLRKHSIYFEDILKFAITSIF